MQGWCVRWWRRIKGEGFSTGSLLAKCQRRTRSEFVARSPAHVEQLETRELLTVTFHGGAVIANVAVQDVFLGSDWNGSALKSQAAKLDTFAATMVQSQFMDGMTLAGYNVYRGSSNAGVIDNLTLDKNLEGNIGGFGGITDTDIQGDIQALINSGKAQQPNANRLYIVYVEPGVIISLQSGVNSFNTFFGYHNEFTGKTSGGTALDIRYAVIAYPGFPTAAAFGSNSTQNLGFSLNQLTTTASHELAEAVTDPDAFTKSVGGWFDDNLGEVGDIVQQDLMVYKGYEIQSVAMQDDSPISFNSITQTLTAPQNVALAPGNLPKTGVLSWTSVALAEGYRVFSVNGTQRNLIATTNASTTSFTLTGLAAGTKLSLQVEAFDGSVAADSKVITGTAPFAQSAAQAAATANQTAANIASAPKKPVIDSTPIVAMPIYFDDFEPPTKRKHS